MNKDVIKNKLKDYIARYNPEGLRIVSTYACKQNCKFCYQKTRKGGFLKDDKLKIILDSIKELNWNPTYITHQGGEISDFEEESMDMFKITDDYFPCVFRKSITTNGLGNIDFYKKSKLYGITHFTTSLHGKNTKLEEKLIELKKDGFLTARVNCFFDIENLDKVKYVFDFCKKNDIQLTICEDLRLSEDVNFNSSKTLYKYIINDSYEEIKHKHQFIYVSEKENYKFWVYKHLDHYDYNNVIIMPNGDITMTFDDIIDCKGNY